MPSGREEVCIFLSKNDVETWSRMRHEHAAEYVLIIVGTQIYTSWSKKKISWTSQPKKIIN
jgi:hypothetical protein